MRDYALSRAEAAEATGSLSLLWRVIRNWRARRAVERLDALDDYLLNDIGVTRADVRAALDVAPVARLMCAAPWKNFTAFHASRPMYSRR